eukprot:352478-Chlamydomonas_euryale.AAC.9
MPRSAQPMPRPAASQLAALAAAGCQHVPSLLYVCLWGCGLRQLRSGHLGTSLKRRRWGSAASASS